MPKKVDDRVTRGFEQSGAQRRFHDRPRREPWRTSPNDLAKWLMNVFVATEEPIFLEAFRLLVAYGCADGARSPARRLKALGTLLATERALRAVDEELKRQDISGERRSLRRAMTAVIETGLVEAPTVAAATKRLQRAYSARAAGYLPTGDTGHKLLVARIEPFEPDGSRTRSCVARDAHWLPNDRATRQMLFHGTFSGPPWVKLRCAGPAANDQALTGHKRTRVNTPPEAHREWDSLLRPERFPPTVGWQRWVIRARQEAGLPKAFSKAIVRRDKQLGGNTYLVTYKRKGKFVCEAESAAHAQIKMDQMFTADLIRHSIQVRTVVIDVEKADPGSSISAIAHTGHGRNGSAPSKTTRSASEGRHCPPDSKRTRPERPAPRRRGPSPP